MAFNIVDLVKHGISDQLLGRIGNAVGLDGSRTSIAMSGALPGLLAGLAGKARQPGGAASLLDGLRDADAGLLGNAGSVPDGGDAARVAREGGSLLQSVLGGDATKHLGGALATFTGLDRDRSGSLLGLLAPVVLGALKDKFTDDGLDAGGLQGLMASQQPNIDAAMPQAFADELRSAGFFDSLGGTSAPAPAAPATATTPPVTPPIAPTPAVSPRAVESRPASGAAPATGNASGGLPKWLIPVLALVVVGLLAFFLLGRDDDQAVVAVTDSPNGVTTEAGDAAALTASGAAGVSAEDMAAASAALPDGVTMDGLTSQLDGIFTSSRQALDGVTDAAGAQAALPTLQDASDEVNNFAGLFKRLPEAAKGPLRQIVSTGVTSLSPIADTALGIPAVGPVLEPVVRPMLAALGGITG